jgi:hypothetical protein
MTTPIRLRLAALPRPALPGPDQAFIAACLVAPLLVVVGAPAWVRTVWVTPVLLGAVGWAATRMLGLRGVAAVIVGAGGSLAALAVLSTFTVILGVYSAGLVTALVAVLACALILVGRPTASSGMATANPDLTNPEVSAS